MSENKKIHTAYSMEVDENGYKIIFITNKREHYLRVESAARKCVDEAAKHNKKIQFDYDDAA